MRKLALLLFLAPIVVPVPVHATRPVTIQQLKRALTSARGKSDAKVSRMLSGLELTERLSAERLSGLEADLPGVESRRSLVLLADLSAFLPPAPTEIPAAAIPDLATQRQVIARVVDYAAKTIHQLPNFIATRDTIRFEDTPAEQTIFASLTPYKPLRAVQDYSTIAYYRDGNEVDSTSLGDKKSTLPARGLITSGEFGPIISTVLLDAAQGEMAWSHWEVGRSEPLAVFRFRISREQSHYKLKFCCVAREGNGVIEQSTGYHGEIAVDPTSGAIFRLTLQADLSRDDEIVRADILVQYGAVEIGGQLYICPVKSISVSVAALSHMMYLRNATRYAPSELDQSQNRAQQQTLLNDVVFDNYHVFRSDVRMLTGDSTSEFDKSTPSVPTQSNPITPHGEEIIQRPETSEARGPSTASPDRRNRSEPQPMAAPEASSPVLASPEISEGESKGLPSVPVTPSTQGRDFSLKVTTRVVDVDVVVLDKKGHPVTGLKPEDFEIFDNSRKQKVRFFSGPANLDPTAPESQPNSSPSEPAYSNRRADIDDPKAGTGTPESIRTILVLDSDNLAWADLAYAREQMLRFLQTMPPSERVGIYVENVRGFRVLMEATSDRAKLGRALREWMPTAREFADAQEAEQRNRQKIDDVGHIEDLQSVNGNVNASPDSTATVDPQLRDFGSDPGGRALSTLVLIARHLAPMPGRKNLVWIASENVLANWTDQAVSSAKGGKHVEGSVLRAQEALNDAHVRIYPVDASQLETQAVDASLENHNVMLATGVTAPPGPQSGGAAPGRITAEMQQDMHSVQGPIRSMAEATGGRVFRRGGDLVANLKSVVEDGRASYLLGFSPDVPADDQYHLLTVKLMSHRGAHLRYRTGYQYSKEPVLLKDRFRQAVWQPLDVNDIAITARALPGFGGAAIELRIAANDLALQLKDGRWNNSLDIFAVQRTVDGRQARISGRQLVLSLLPTTYQNLMETGIPFDQFVEKSKDTAYIRIIVVDEASGRMGSVTLPAEFANGK